MRRMELDAGIKNIMVIVPHEDDEILLAAGIMEKALAKGIGVHVVMAGNGDYEGHDEATGSVRAARDTGRASGAWTGRETGDISRLCGYRDG